MIVARTFELAARVLWAIGFGLGDVARGIDRVERAVASVADRLLDNAHAAGDIACAIAEVLEDLPTPLDPLELALEHMLGVPNADAVVWAPNQERALAAFEVLHGRALARRLNIKAKRGYRSLEDLVGGGRVQVLSRDGVTIDSRHPTLEVQV